MGRRWTKEDLKIDNLRFAVEILNEKRKLSTYAYSPLNTKLAEAAKEISDLRDSLVLLKLKDENASSEDVVKGVLKEILTNYFSIGDSYCYHLKRDKEAFAVGTMSLEDFEEFSDDTVDDLAAYIVEALKQRAY